MDATFDRRLRKQSVKNRLGVKPGAPKQSKRKPAIVDLRVKISNPRMPTDARQLLNQNKFKGRRGINRSVSKTPTVPFIIPTRTVQNEYFQNKKSPIFTKRGKQALQFGAAGSGSFVRTISNNPSDLALPQASGSIVSPIQGFRLHVKNLATSVTLDDVYELFSGVGPLRSCNIVRPGHAEVVFKTAEDAQSATQSYNGRELDGRPMNVTMTTPVPSNVLKAVTPKPRKNRMTPKPQPMEIPADVINRALHRVPTGTPRPVRFNVNL